MHLHTYLYIIIQFTRERLCAFSNLTLFGESKFITERRPIRLVILNTNNYRFVIVNFFYNAVHIWTE